MATTRSMDVVECEATCLEPIDEVSRNGGRVAVTKDGHPFVELRPHKPDDSTSRAAK